ncbi:MAG: hypothetical protein II759_05750 [Lachnospiraceae bacterium]|nr:hypothetical protein [Lachnospiraceae bacterium]
MALDDMKNTGKEDTSGHEITAKGYMRYLVNILVLCGIILALTAAVVFLLVRLGTQGREYRALEEELSAISEGKQYYTDEELKAMTAESGEREAVRARSALLQQIQSSLESGESTISMLRKLFPGDLVVKNGEKYYFYPVDAEAPKNGFGGRDFRLDDQGHLSYVGDEDVGTVLGIDIPDASAVTSWDDVKESGVSFAFLEIFREEVSPEDGGTSYVPDESFAGNVHLAGEAGIETGGSFSLHALSADEAETAADAAVQVLKEAGLEECPVALAVLPGTEDQASPRLSRSEWTENVLAAAARLRENGYRPVIQGTIASFTMMLEISELEEVDKWIMNYREELYYPYDFTYWQYATTGQVNGITGNVNMDIRVFRSGQ